MELATSDGWSTLTLIIMHLSMWILPPLADPRKSDLRKYLSVRICSLPWTFTVRIPSQKIYCNVRIMMERIALFRISVLWDRPMLEYKWWPEGGGVPQDSLWQVHNHHNCDLTLSVIFKFFLRETGTFSQGWINGSHTEPTATNKQSRHTCSILWYTYVVGGGIPCIWSNQITIIINGLYDVFQCNARPVYENRRGVPLCVCCQ